MQFVSVFRVISQNRKSKARYVDQVKVGDIIKAEMDLVRTTGASSGNYALGFGLYREVDGEFIHYAGVSQNELPKGFSVDPNNRDAVFLVQQLDPR